MKLRFIYTITVILTICCGMVARKLQILLPHWINFWLGDALYAFMMYYIVAIVFTYKPTWVKAAIALLICCCIELSQLYEAEWLINVRQTLPGRLVLGQGFLWSDLLAYLCGVAAAYCVDILWLALRKTAH